MAPFATIWGEFMYTVVSLCIMFSYQVSLSCNLDLERLCNHLLASHYHIVQMRVVPKDRWLFVLLRLQASRRMAGFYAILHAF